MSSVHPFKVLASRLEREPLWRSELLDTDLDLKSSSKVGEFLLHAFPDLRLRSSLSNFKSWFNRFSRNYPLTYAAILQAAAIRYQRNRAKRSLVSRLLLNPNAPSTKSAIRTLWESIPVYVVSRLSAPYPPKGFWIVDHDPIWDLWYNHLQYGKQPDARIARRPMMRVDSTALQFDLGPEESGRFNESDGTPVMMVMRDFCSLVEIVSWVNDIVLRNVACQRNVRKEDAGCIVICGWSAGSRSKPAFDFVRNFLTSKSDAEKRSLQYEAASAFALFWNMVCALGPAEVLSDIEHFLSTTKIYGMDANLHAGGPENVYTVPINGIPITFRNARMAPPSGVFARNYARAVHNEVQPHKWSIAWTTFRASINKELGGHFYNSDYGIRICSAINTAVFWQPEHFHGTSLQDVPPSEKGGPVIQSGLSIVTSSRLPAIFDKFIQGTLPEKQLIRACFTTEEDLLADRMGRTLSLT
ncbi:hypothetical protein F5876DRAFT_65728 [Lentinula aff. lateritia]|uniref:Uncharacterized protein n=1 Tax=Lentinula aff. lateritia TaxID=2804960 RepID=A0ACC1U0S2_9AGAR|nr:hypothetical protein F5876DRAFT_65728 [Lentinula aff. lateritia]